MKSVLIVEDEALLALCAGVEIEGSGNRVAGVAHSVSQALDWLSRESADLAVIDYNLGGETSEPVADALRARGIPYAVVSGASRQRMEDAGFAPDTIHAKPANYRRIVEQLALLVPREGLRSLSSKPTMS